MAVIRPCLKKSSLDPEVLANYRPISNLQLISKVLEKLIGVHLQDYLKYNNLLETFQSFQFPLCPQHRNGSGEGHEWSPDGSRCWQYSFPHPAQPVCCMWYCWHGILLNCLHHTIGFTDTALNWFQSYLTDKTEYISWGNTKSQSHEVTCGSVLGPIVFIILYPPLVRSSVGMEFLSTYMQMTHNYIWKLQLWLCLHHHHHCHYHLLHPHLPIVWRW